MGVGGLMGIIISHGGFSSPFFTFPRHAGDGTLLSICRYANRKWNHTKFKSAIFVFCHFNGLLLFSSWSSLLRLSVVLMRPASGGVIADVDVRFSVKIDDVCALCGYIWGRSCEDIHRGEGACEDCAFGWEVKMRVQVKWGFRVLLYLREGQGVWRSVESEERSMNKRRDVRIVWA
jgi:hypothetical protein